MAAEVGKLFVGGMSWQTTEDTMSSYFSRFGEVEECIVMKDRNTGNPRGFGFIKFKDPECVDEVLKSKPHVLDDKAVDVKPCAPKDVPDPGMVDMVQGVVTDKWVTTTSNMREDQHEVVRTKGLVAATIRTVNRLLCFRFLNNFLECTTYTIE